MNVRRLIITYVVIGTLFLAAIVASHVLLSEAVTTPHAEPLRLVKYAAMRHAPDSHRN